MPTLAPTTATVKPVTFVVAQTARELYNRGFTAYCDGVGYFDMATPAERRGWMAANKAEAEAGIPGYAEKRGW